jgi:L-lactate dehydrogenase
MDGAAPTDEDRMAQDPATPTRYAAEMLGAMAIQLLRKAGLPPDRAAAVGEILLEGDLMGHSTHGLALLAPYLAEIEKGTMTVTGEPEIIADHGAAVTWDGRYLPGPWLVYRAMDLAIQRAYTHKVATVVIRRSSHIGCLAAYLKRATDSGLMMMLTCSDPSVRSVTPFGGATPVFTPNPLAFGWPTDGEPVIIDISASTTTNGMTIRTHQHGGKLGGAWLTDAAGNATNDPAVLFNKPKGAILPLGGSELGHKGFGLALLVEALTAALGGHGRADGVKNWGASVFLQIIDPEGFGGRDAFERETSWLAQTCRDVPAPPGKPPVRLPGERGLKLRTHQLLNGVALHPDIMPSLLPWAGKLGVQLPAPRG